MFLDDKKYDDAAKKVDSVDRILTDNRRIDDALLSALSLVLSSNSEYAKSVSALLENDLSREQAIEQLNDSSQELLKNTRDLIKSQEQLQNILNNLDKEYKRFLGDSIQNYVDSQQIYIDKKFKVLYENVGLKEDGSNYGPSDKLILRIKDLVTHEFWVLVLGAVLYQIITLAFKYFKGQ